MRLITKLYCFAVCLICTTITTNAADSSGGLTGEVVGEEQFVVRIALDEGPIVANPFVRIVMGPKVSELREHGFTSTDVRTKFNPNDFTVNASDKTNFVLYTMADIMARGTNTFTMAMIRFGQWSADSANALTNSASYAEGDWNFSDTEIGEDVNGQVLKTGSAAGVQLRRLTLGGLQSKYFEYSDESYHSFLDSYLTNVIKTFWSSVQVVSNDTVVASAKRVVTTSVVPSQSLTLYTAVSTNGIVSLGVTNTVTQTILVEKTSSLEGTNLVWRPYATFNNGQTVTLTTTDANGYFRASVQGSH
jgi:hypothetical protein